MPPSTAFLQAQKHRMQKNGVVDGSDEPPAEEEEIEVAMMEELTFGMICIPSSFYSHLLLFCYFVKFTPSSGKRTGKEDRHFLEKKFMPFTDEFKPLLERCNSLYGLLDNFPYSQLLIRSDEATKICILVILIFFNYYYLTFSRYSFTVNNGGVQQEQGRPVQGMIHSSPSLSLFFLSSPCILSLPCPLPSL